MFPIFFPWKHQKTLGLLKFLGYKMGTLTRNEFEKFHFPPKQTFKKSNMQKTLSAHEIFHQDAQRKQLFLKFKRVIDSFIESCLPQFGWYLCSWESFLDEHQLHVEMRKFTCWDASESTKSTVKVRDHPFSTSAKFFEKLTFLYLLIRIRTRTCAYQEVKNVSFSRNFAYVLSECPPPPYIIFLINDTTRSPPPFLYTHVRLLIRGFILNQFFQIFLGINKKQGRNRLSTVSAILSQPAFTCSKLAIETLEQGNKYVQSWIIRWNYISCSVQF